MLLKTLMSDPDWGQKLLPHPPAGFLVFFGARCRRVGGLGRASPLELYDARDAFVSVLVGSRRSRIVELRTPATPVGVGGGKERGGCHLNLRT